MLRYLPEFILLIFFTLSGLQLIDNSKSQHKAEQQNKTLQALQQNVSDIMLETLKASSTYVQHYDKHAQLQLNLQKLHQQLDAFPQLQSALYTFDREIAEYMQFITVLKTSRRFILSLETGANSTANTDKMQAMLLTYIQAPQLQAEQEVKSFIQQHQANLQARIDPIISWSMLAKHINFVLNNSRQSEQALLKLQQTQLPSQLVELNRLSSQQLLSTNRQWSIWAGLLLLSLFGLVLNAMLRQGKQLQLKSQEAMASSEIKTQFLANMSHEIRTPMNGIIGLTDLCLTTELNNTQTSYLQKIQFSARSLMTIINDILDFSKIESQKLVIENIDFNTGELLDNLKMMLSKPASEKGIEFIFDVDPQLPKYLNGDPIRIGQVMLNLTSNAIKFTQQGHVLVKIFIQTEQEVEQHLHCQVEDTGIGLTDEQTKRLFRRFSQAQASTTREYGGTGLGLAISRSLVELMHGQISVESEPGKGSVFSFHLPCATAEVPSTDHLLLQQFPAQKLLVVEDHILTAEVLKNMAQHLELDVDIAATPRQAMALVKRTQYQYALVDWQLPDMNGLQLIKALEQQSNKPEKILLCTGFDSDSLKQQMQQEHSYKLLIKPVSLFELSDALSEQADNPEEAEQTSSQPQTSKIQNQDKRHILLVEDNEINQLIAINMLEHEGVMVDIAENGQQAVDMVKNNRYDLVLMDIQMPIMDGLQATQVIRQQLCDQKLPIIALTANVMTQEIEHYMQIGMNDHLGKPFEKEQLHNLLQHYLH